jgi:hypothetical protein
MSVWRYYATHYSTLAAVYYKGWGRSGLTYRRDVASPDRW